MEVIKAESFEEAYYTAAIKVLNEGDEVSPRGTKTYELAPATIVVENPRKFLAMPTARKGNYIFQLAEFLWMMRGSNDLEEIAHYNRVWRYFEDSDEPGILNGAYGERLRAWNGHLDQFYAVFQKLKKDPYSRQAVMIIFDPERDNLLHEDGNYSKDIPCTNYFNFQIRDGKLNMYVVMRSNDIHKGMIYDVPNFILMQHILAGWLEVEVGKYTHTAASLHIYENDVDNFMDFLFDDEEFLYEDELKGELLDIKMTLPEFNKTMYDISYVEGISRCAQDLGEFEIEVCLDIIKGIENEFWRGCAAAIALYNLRKLGASEEQYGIFKPYVTNDYRPHVEKLKPIRRK